MLYYGASPMAYTNAICCSTNGVIVNDLTWGTRYYFAVTAVNTNGLEGNFSPEAELLLPAVPRPPSNLRKLVSD
jgi:hypothetical protein